MNTFFQFFRNTALIITVILFTQQVLAQEPAFYKDIQAFKKHDSTAFPHKGAILFIGSSSFTLWKDVQNRFPDYTILNRAFGGSSLHHLSYYIKDIVYAYSPRQIIVYCGENDLAASPNVSAQTVAYRFITLFSEIRDRYPTIPIAFVAMKPSPSRQKEMPRMVEGNKLIEAFLKTQEYADFIDIYPAMLDESGKPRPELFVQDMLHMNSAGYDIWQKAILPYLKK